MSILVWMIVGLISGFIANWLVSKSGSGLIICIALGIAGALVGGSLFNTLGVPIANGLNLFGVLVAALGSISLLVLYHLLFPPMRSK